MGLTVFQQTVGDVASFEYILIEVLLHCSVDSPAHYLHSTLCPELNIVPD